MPTALLLVFEIIGTVAFAISGAIVAMQHKLDYFGIFLLAVTTSIGGGVLRDIILGVSPPVGLVNPIYLTTASITTFLLLALGRFRRLVSSGSPVYTWSYYISDALGLAVFTVIGVDAAISAGYEKEGFLCIFVAMLTGVGGGMIRDVLVQQIPVVLRREIYALASVAGALLYYFARTHIPQSVAVLLSVLLTVSIRMLSLYFNIHVPSIQEIKEES
ncbi:trimeric intracellular cation channel family protein [Faecalispora anaeroviscerum]|uniref:trimeric intracellular cation channel family protein n=1 Tax=Faecalispora anaeroviscerum TaxID=2991836 RepID=UPI0024BB251A|nr:trimeric intracellular cation channel family protein [Faecalispora anaeroviscerum]